MLKKDHMFLYFSVTEPTQVLLALCKHRNCVRITFRNLRHSKSEEDKIYSTDRITYMTTT